MKFYKNLMISISFSTITFLSHDGIARVNSQDTELNSCYVRGTSHLKAGSLLEDTPVSCRTAPMQRAIDLDEKNLSTFVASAFYAYDKNKEREDYQKFISQGWKPYNFAGEYGVNNTKYTAGTVFVRGNEIIVSYRGTIYKEDWLTNINIGKEDGKKLGLKGTVHKGFYKAAASTFEGVDRILEQIYRETGKAPKDFTYVMTGHSLGGAMTQIYAAHLSQKLGLSENSGLIKVITLAAPRWASEETAALYDARIGADNHLRFVIYGDPVPHANLKAFSAKHTGTQIEISPSNAFSKIAGDAYNLNEDSTFFQDFKAGFLSVFDGTLLSLGAAPVKFHDASHYLEGAIPAFKSYKNNEWTIRGGVAVVTTAAKVVYAPMYYTWSTVGGFVGSATSSVVDWFLS